MKRKNVLFAECLLGVLLAAFSGCASVPEPSGFLQGQADRMTEGRYFKQEFVALGTDFTKYRKVRIEPIELGFLDSDTRGRYDRAVLDRLASRFGTDLANELGKKYLVVGPSVLTDGETLVVRAALINVQTPYRLLNAATTALIFVPVTSGSAAFEARLTDGADGKLLAQIAEKRTNSGDAKSLAVGSYTKFTHAEGIFALWAKKLAVFLQGT